MAPNFLAWATTLENLGARWLLAKKVNFVPCSVRILEQVVPGSILDDFNVRFNFPLIFVATALNTHKTEY